MLRLTTKWMKRWSVKLNKADSSMTSHVGKTPKSGPERNPIAAPKFLNEAIVVREDWDKLRVVLTLFEYKGNCVEAPIVKRIRYASIR